MVRSQQVRIALLVVCLALLVALAITPWASAAPSGPSPEQVVQRAWQRAQELGAYRFTTDLRAIIYPASGPVKLGRSGQQQRLHMEGQVDLPARSLLLSLWQGGGSVANPRDGLEVRIEGERAYGRSWGGEWQEIDDFSGAFAPGQDPLAYLAGARDVVELGTETRVLSLGSDDGPTTMDGGSLGVLRPSSIVQFTRYGFELDGPALGQHLRDQLEEGLRGRGELPPGVSLDVPAGLQEMTGGGEVWIDSRGLPLRLVVELEYPQENGEQSTSRIQTDFSGFSEAIVARGPRFQDDPVGWAAGTLGLPSGPAAWQRWGTEALLWAGLLGLVLLAARLRRSRALYIALILATILSMVLSPLLQSQQIYAFGERQKARQQEAEARQAGARQQRELQQALASPSWAPHLDPQFASKQLSELSGQPQAGDAPPAVFGPALAGDDLDPEGDEDGDTLTNIEEQRLGTDPENADTDSDLLRDDLEVQGFDLGGKHWYTDPRNPDTNGDGLPDTRECWTTFPPVDPAPGTEPQPYAEPCDLDTDGDHEPGIWDRDNDGDGVPDSEDYSPFSSMTGSKGYFSDGDPFHFRIDQLKRDDQGRPLPVSLDLQLRPTNPAHLNYSFNVLDWPAGDAEGQVQHVKDTTFADGLEPEEVEADPASRDGDMRLIPILEISVPYEEGHTRNLPVKADWSGTLTATTPLEDWLDMAKLEPYGIGVRYLDEEGTLAIDVPLNLVTDETGGGEVAFLARLLYWPQDPEHWGQNHEVRVVWLVEVLIDQCDAEGLEKHWKSYQEQYPEDAAEPGAYDAERQKWCAQPEHRTADQPQIVQAYSEEWVLTGLSVREDHGVEAAIAWEDPQKAVNQPVGENLTRLAYGLDHTFLAGRGRDTDGDGIADERDLTVADIRTRFDNRSNGGMGDDDPRLWGISKDALQVDLYPFAHQGLIAAIPMTYTKEILNRYFLAGGQPRIPDPGLLFAREEHYRSANLDSSDEVMKRDGSTLTMTMAEESVTLDTLASMSWHPYRYRNGQWEPYPMDKYWELMDERLKEIFPVDPDEPNAEARAQGRIALAKCYYMGLAQGTSVVVERGHMLVEQEEQAEGDEAVEHFAKGGEFLSKLVELFGEQLFEHWFAGGHGAASKEALLEQFGAFAAAETGGLARWLGLTTAGKFTWAKYFKNLRIYGVLFAAAVALTFFVLSFFVHAPVVEHIEQGLMVAANTYLFVMYVAEALGKLYDLYKEWKTLRIAIMELWKDFVKEIVNLNQAVLATSIVLAIIAVVVNIAIFVVRMIASHTHFLSLGFDAAFAAMVSQVIVQILMIALFAIPIIGPIIATLITLIDSVIRLICGLIGEEFEESKVGQWVCGGLTGAVAKGIQWVFYGQQVMINMDDPERVALSAPMPALRDPESGLSAGNALAYQLTVTDTIHLEGLVRADWKQWAFAWQYNMENLEKAAFEYELTAQKEAELPYGLSLGDMAPPWKPGPEVDGKKTRRAVVDVASDGAICELSEPGLNVKAPLWLHEGYAVPAQECIAVPTPVSFLPLIPICWVRVTRGTVPLDLSLKWDIFPADLDGFHELVEVGTGGWSLAWGQVGDFKFARQKDADGDGLRNRVDGGPDTDDSRWDADGDGLSDYFEQQAGTHPGNADTDGDGLNDAEEMRHGADPKRADTDGDGLTDREEVEGWAFAYALGPDNKPKTTWVRSDPVLIDLDMDTLDDFREFTFRYHPATVSDPNVLGFEATVEEVSQGGDRVPTDGFLQPGDKLHYQASVKNKTLLARAQGLLSAQVSPEGQLSGVVPPETFVLYPQEQQAMGGDLEVRTNATSGPADLTQTAGAQITAPPDGHLQSLLHFEEPITATIFLDSSGTMPRHNGQCEGAHCPKRQVPGYEGSAVGFDAQQEQLITVPLVDLRTGDFGVSLWFKTAKGDAGIFSSQDGSLSIYLQVANVCSTVKTQKGDETLCTPYPVYADGQWHHLAHTFGARIGGQKLYVDGELLASGDPAAGRLNPDPQLGLRIGHSTYAARYFSGTLDELAVYDRALTHQDVGALYRKPLFSMHLDDAAGSRTFSNADGYPVGRCETSPLDSCPSPAQPGVLRSSVEFAGDDYIRLLPDPRLNLEGSPFTLATWIYPTLSGDDARDSHPQGILGSGSHTPDAYPTLERVGDGIQVGFGDGEHDHSFPVVPGVLTLNGWNHVVLTYGQDQEGLGQLDLYVNGRKASRWPLDGFPTPSAGESFDIGRSSSCSSVHYEGIYGLVAEMPASNYEIRFYDVATERFRVSHSGLQGNQFQSADKTGQYCDVGTVKTYLDGGHLSKGDFDFTFALPSWDDDGTSLAAAQRWHVKVGEYNSGSGKVPLLALRFDHVNPSIPFHGRIDEVLVYNYALSDASVDELYRLQSLALELPFDDPPGSYRFENATGGAPASCPSNLAGCPTGGIGGRINQAALFDGVDDYVDAGQEPAVDGQGAFAVGAWVKTRSTAGQGVIIQQRSAQSSAGEYQLSVTAGGKVHWMTFGDGQFGFQIDSSKTISDGAWHHIVGLRESDGTGKIYIDGQLDGSQQTPSRALVATNVFIGADMRDRVAYFGGQIDEAFVARRAMSEQEVDALYRSAPQLVLHLDEGAGATRFVDDSQQGHDGTCSGDACPTAGTKGQIGLAAQFDGVDDGVATDYETPRGQYGEGLPKTVMAWVYPDSTGSDQHVVVGTEGGLDAWALFRQGDTWHVAAGGGAGSHRWDYDTGVPVQVGRWQHLAAVFENQSVRFFFNGSASDPEGFSFVAIDAGGKVGVGYDPQTSGRRFDGRIDEVAIYERALSDLEIHEMWLYQGQWVEERQTFSLVVDNDDPVSHLDLSDAYLPNVAATLHIVAEDKTSGVVQVEWQVGSGAWQQAPPCTDADLGAAWCATFDPSPLGGEGVYTIQTRATDGVGHVSAESNDALRVDGTPPQVTSTLQDGALIRLEPVPDQRDTLAYSFSGTVSDPEIASGVAGSGVRSVVVTLLDSRGAPVRAGGQAAVVDGNAWHVDYQLSEPVSSGPYRVRIRAEDQVGNGTVDETRTVYLDRTAPDASLAGLPPAGALVILHLEEAAGATSFSDSSGHSHHATCAPGSCPTAGVDGRYGQGVELDGTRQYLTLGDPLDLARSGYTLAAWFRTSGAAWQTILAASGVGSDVMLLQLNPAGKLVYSYSPPGGGTSNLNSSRSYNDGAWHHAAAVQRGGDLLLYVDGAIADRKADSRTVDTGLSVVLGQHSSADYFQGRLDEAYLFPVGLAYAEVRSLAADNPQEGALLGGVVSEVPIVPDAVLEMHLEEPKGATAFADSSEYGNDGTCSGAACPGENTDGTFGRALQFDGTDDHLSVINSPSLYSLLNNLTVAAWIKPVRLSDIQRIVAYSRTSGDKGFGFGTNGAHLLFTTYGRADYLADQVTLANGQWQHVAAIMDGDNNVTFYLNGVPVQAVEGKDPVDPNTSDKDSLFIGATTDVGKSTLSTLFAGAIDEAYVFGRALSADEILALGTKKHAGVARLEMAFTPTSAGSPLYNAPMPAGAALYLPLDDNEDAAGNLRFLDISGLGHNGTCSGTACPSMGHSGHRGTAALFDGVDDYVTLGESPDHKLVDQGTISAWIYPTAATDYGPIVNKEGEYQVIRAQNDAIRWAFANIDPGWQYVDTGYLAALDRWTHVAVVYDGGVVKTYADGVLVHTYSGSGVIGDDDPAQNELRVGGRQQNEAHRFAGLIDEVLILNQALSGDEVRGLYLGTEAVLHLPFDESWAADGTTLPDLSGFGHDGTLHGRAVDHMAAGAVGRGALVLDGAQDYASTAGSLDFARGDYAVSAWFRTSAASQQSIVAATDPGSDALGIQLLVLADGRVQYTHQGTSVTSSAASTDGAWHHAVAVQEGAQMRLYVDGALVASQGSGTALASALSITVGRRGWTTAQEYFHGALDEVQIHARALSAQEVRGLFLNAWGTVPLAGTGTGVVRGGYRGFPLRSGLEGFYQVGLRGWDIFDNRDDRGQSAWGGGLDTLAPRAELRYELESAGSSSQIHYRLWAEDFNLVEGGLQSPCADTASLSRTYFNAPWYRAVSGQTEPNTHKLFSLAGECEAPFSGEYGELTVCDSAGNCTTVPAAPLSGGGAAPALAGGDAGVIILGPVAGGFMTGTGPVQVLGNAYSPGFLKGLTVTVDGRTVYEREWPQPSTTEASWAAPWTPSGEGPHQIEAQLEDWAGAVYRDSAAVVLDTQPPLVTVATEVLNSTRLVAGQLSLRGMAEDANGIERVEVRLGSSDWRPATLHDGTWSSAWYAGPQAPAEGESLEVTARAVDRAGWTATTAELVLVDVVPPSPVELTLSYEDGGTSQAITQTGVTIYEAAPTLELAWTASSDGSGLEGYRASWTGVGAQGAWEALADYSPGDERRHTYTPGEAQKVSAQVGAHDVHGNQRGEAFGPLYVDSPLTPDYISISEAKGIYHGWMAGGCSRLGVDGRIERVLSELATRDAEQALYATWDSQALRLAWTGANWAGDGDLWVYLDTAPGGALEVHNPYTSSITTVGASDGALSNPNQTTIHFPGVTPTGLAPDAMQADYAVWVEDSATAWLLCYDGAAWQVQAQLGAAEYRYSSGLTDLYLPFALLGIEDPAATSLDLVAFATEEDALALWAVLPAANPVSSGVLVGAVRANLETAAFALDHRYHWAGLGDGVCPNGSQTLLAGQRPYPAADVQVGLVAEPSGAVYRYLGDHLFPWWDTLRDDKPAEAASLLGTVDKDHPVLWDGQEIVYRLRYRNAGEESARNVRAQIRTRYTLRLPDGAPLASGERRYYQEVTIGDLEPGQEGEVTIRGVVDLAWARPGYEACLANQPDEPAACDVHLRWALLEVAVLDDMHDEAAGPLEWIWADHEVDHQPPQFFGTHWPRYLVGPVGRGVLQGYAYDPSGVHTLSLQIRGPAGQVTTVACPNPTPHDGHWSCRWDPVAAAGGALPADGERFELRLQAVDGAGQVSPWGNWQPVIVDTVAPTVTVHSTATQAIDGLPLSARSLRLSGQALDNRALAGVEVCLADECQRAPLALEAAPLAVACEDVPPAPMAIDAAVACGQGQIVRAFEVAERFPVGGVSLGFRIEHTDRHQIRAVLVSPAGTRVQVLGDDYDLSTSAADYSVLLVDAAPAGLHESLTDHDLELISYNRNARPYAPLSAFVGEESAGTWRLEICDAQPAGDEGAYHSSELSLQPQESLASGGAWRHNLSFGELDNMPQTVTVSGLDEAGNRTAEPWTLTFQVDNVAPAVDVTQVISEVQMTPELSAHDVLSGTVSDGGEVRRLFALVHNPEGQVYTGQVAREDERWSFALRPTMAGVYQIWIVAEDLSQNQAYAGPLAVRVKRFPVPWAYLPLVRRDWGAPPETWRLWLPLVLKESARSRTAPETSAPPSPTSTDGALITPTLTMTATAVVTPTLTVTPTTTAPVAPTLTVTPTAAAIVTPTRKVTQTAGPLPAPVMTDSLGRFSTPRP